MESKKNKPVYINLPHLPGKWSEMTLGQLRSVEKINGKFTSELAYLAHCFLELEGLKPLQYAERWRSVLGTIPLLGRLVAKTGRQVEDVMEGCGEEDEPIVIWKQCYRFKGVRNAILGKRFFMEDQEMLSFQKKLEFLCHREEIYIYTNPIATKRAGMRIFRSYFTNLADMPWIHYRLCCMHLQNYTTTKQVIHLDKFLSVLYVPEGRICRLLNRLSGKSHPKHFSRYFSQLEINLVLIFWNSTQQYYRTCFSHLFNNKGDKKKHDFMKEEAEITVFLSKEIGTVPENAQNLEVFYALQYLEDNAVLQEEKKKEIERIKRMR